MSENSLADLYVDHIKSHILPFIDYSELQQSYETDMVYAKGILNRLHITMGLVYGGETLDIDDCDDGFVVVPGVVCGRESGKMGIALFTLDLSSSGEHWGTDFLCQYGVISQDIESTGKISNNDRVLMSEAKEVISSYLPYDYGYTATIPDDIHVDIDALPYQIKDVLGDFRNHHAELLFEEDAVQGDRSADAHNIQGVTTVRISEQEFERKMRELLPNASEEAIQDLIEYAEELDERGTHPKGAFFSETYVNFNLAARQYGADITNAVLKVCEESCLNPWEIRDAARLMADGASQSDIVQKTTDGDMDYQPEHWDELDEGLAALQKGTLAVPTADETLREQETPAQAALYEPDIYDDEATAALRERLIERLDGNLAEYFTTIHELDNKDIAAWSFEIAAVTGAYHYLTEYHNFHASELNYLMLFQNPLKIVADKFETAGLDNRADIMWDIFDSQDALEGDYERMPDTSAADALKQELFDRLDENLNDFRDEMLDSDKGIIFDSAEEIAAHYAAREYMKTAYDYKTGEVEYLLQFQDPLSLVASKWLEATDHFMTVSDVITGVFEDKGSHGHYARVMDADNPAAKESAKLTTGAEKQSVLERIRAAEKEQKPPRKDKTSRDKSGPEH